MVHGEGATKGECFAEPPKKELGTPGCDPSKKIASQKNSATLYRPRLNRNAVLGTLCVIRDWAFKPFTIIPKIGHEFIVFFALTLVCGHIGIIVGGLLKALSTGLWQFLVTQFQAGVLFNMAIAFIVSAITPVFLEMQEKPDEPFRKMKIAALSISVVFCFFCLALLFNSDRLGDGATSIILQAVFYLISLYLTTYLFLLQYLKRDYENFAQYDDKNRSSIVNDASSSLVDSRGVRS